MPESPKPQTVGGYRVGRRVGEGRFLGHALAPALVELIFLDDVSADEQKRIFSETRDFTSLPDGGRVAILARREDEAGGDSRRNDPPIRLTTPPDLAESWRFMEEVTATAALIPGDEKTNTDSLLVRVTGLIKRARRGPVVLAMVAGVIAVLAVVLLMPTSPSGTQANASANSGADTMDTLPVAEQTAASQASHSKSPAPSPFAAAPEPVVPQSTLGDFALVRLPSASGEGAGDIAVLERTDDSWIVRETYPATTGPG
jgi:hypothetical protein